MTPKEKAKTLYDTHYLIVSNVYDSLRTKKEMAKEASLVSIRLLLQPFLIDYELVDHFKEVKQEIEKL